MNKISSFAFDLRQAGEARETLTFTLSLAVKGTTIWPVANEAEHPLEIQIDDLFSYLVEFWKPLLLRQTYPLALSPARPSQLHREVAKRWEDKPQAQIDEEASLIADFEEAHDLSQAFGGVFDLSSPLWLVREGDNVICDTGKFVARLPFENVYKELTRIGNAISEHLLSVDSNKWNRIVDAWNSRDKGNEINLVSWSASIEPVVAEQLITSGLIEPPQNFDEAANDNNELLIAARMAGALPTNQIIEILSLARRFKQHAASNLDALSESAIRHLQSQGFLKPFGEGEELARFVRQWFKIGPSERFDIFDISKSLDIEILVEAIGPSTLDGIAIAGAHYGPGAFINANGSRIRDRNSGDFSNDPGARINLAHELCHLIIDRKHSLSAVEVLRSRMPAIIESRARAFAAELLLPATAAADLWDRAGSPITHSELEAVLQELADNFDVSFSVAAWKLEHGVRTDRPDLSAMLDVLAHYR